MDVEYIKACGFQNPLVYHLRDITNNRFLHRILAIVCTPFGLIKSLVPARDTYNKNKAIVAIAKNEAQYLKEWVEFYSRHDFDNIILFDNDSTDNTREVLHPYIDSGFVIYHEIHGKMRQYDAYHMAVSMYKTTYKYLTFLDCDEFMFCKGSSVFDFVDKILSKLKNGGVLGSIGWYSDRQGLKTNRMVM